mgnify:CR=1 FL=1
MNRKGFTLIELLAVIILVALIGVLVIPSVIDTAKQTKQKAYDILIENIGTAAKTYFEECEYGNLSELDYEGAKACTINDDNSIKTTLGTLANLGFLPTKETYEDSNKRKVSNPIDNQDISDCQIKITKEKVTNESQKITTVKVTYRLLTLSEETKCPSLSSVVIKWYN